MSQKDEIKAYLLSGKSLTSLETLYRFGSNRLAARIKELKKEGMNIESTFIEVNKKWVVRYNLKF